MDTNLIESAVEKGIISTEQFQLLRELAAETQSPGSGLRLDLATILWVGGAGVVIFGLVALSMEAAAISDEALAALFCVYAIIFAALSAGLNARKKSALLCAILATAFAICLTLSVVFLQLSTQLSRYFFEYPSTFTPSEDYQLLLHQIDFVTWAMYSAVAPSLVLFCASLFAFIKFRFLPAWCLLVGSLFALSQEVAILWYFDPHGYNVVAKWQMIIFGVVLYLSAWSLDLTVKDNHGFWLNKLGMIPLSVGLGMMFSDGDVMVRWLFLCLSCAAIAMSVFLRRPSGIGFGALGIITVIVWRFDVHENDLELALSLTAIGFLTIAAGYYAQKHVSANASFLPRWVRAIRPDQRNDPVTFGY